jgi:hypothetical protein
LATETILVSCTRERNRTPAVKPVANHVSDYTLPVHEFVDSNKILDIDTYSKYVA